MNCESTRERLSAWIDGELEATEAAAVAEHIENCAECRRHADSLRELDGELDRTFADHAAAARSVADRVVAAFAGDAFVAESSPNPAPEPAPPTVPGRGSVASLWMAAAAGFLLAVLLFQPWRTREVTRVVERIVEVPANGNGNGESPIDAGIARFVVATGPVAVRTDPALDWSPVTDLKTFSCPTNAEVRTEPGTRAELHTRDGCVIRLDDGTRLTVKSPREVELGEGQIWCRSPEDVPLAVVAREARNTGSPAIDASCVGSSAWSALPIGGVRVTTDEGTVSVRTPEGEHRLGRGESMVVRDGKVAPDAADQDPLLATRWIHPLLVRKGYGDEELRRRVDGYLARIGQTKMSFLYEQEVRSLGEYAALPMLRFVQSDLSREEPVRRSHAAAILADVAPSWMVGELIELLADEDATVRTAAARGLERLTTLTMGRPPTEWNVPPEESEPTRTQWAAWWTTNQDRYPVPSELDPTVAD